ncbi:BMP family ABC transporter substrate-binding protein [Clostridium sp. NSJ-6]|uniref:BMP family ABC transporter substrate-binding protein n=1 Tax=Clostridium hominis TaxID=2763036 RepID=A0ABR7DCK5_9CLOT|nr:BMP family ABC transporter substrate-binding protein [Clostridium hominis]MBC5629131.1 BMP family ABC transporter substrate-binding protein [Clostridium hominis]MDU2671809.1 BMP family ABC transporter substrate-binding protein [Clostridium sp.]
MKKRAIALALSALMLTGLVGCGSKSEGGDTQTPAADGMKVGMVTDSGTIDDKSFNQGTWEGIIKAEAELGVDKNYIKPSGETEADYLKEIQNLYDTDYKFIVTPGFKFETAINKAQEKYSDAKFVILDGAPQDGNNNYNVADNTVAIYFAEHEAGFMAGVATALELKEGELGFIGGMEIPAVQKFNWGFQQGVAYANENLGTKMSLKEENVKYEGTFNNTAGGTQLAATMFDRGVKAIFCAAGGVGVGAITEAKSRVEAGKEAWIIGVDVDQYNDGLLSNGKSVILTSATKKISQAAFDMIKAELDGKFPGGETLTFDAKNDGVGIPAENPNLSKETTDKVAEVFEKVKSGEITVSGEQGDLIK